jgi:hypothetical protein
MDKASKKSILKILIIGLGLSSTIISIYKTWKDNRKLSITLLVIAILTSICLISEYFKEQKDEINTKQVHLDELNKQKNIYRNDSLLRENQYLKQMSLIEFIAKRKQDSLNLIINNIYIKKNNTTYGDWIPVVDGHHNTVNYHDEKVFSKERKDEIRNKLSEIISLYPNTSKNIKFNYTSNMNDELVQEIKKFVKNFGYNVVYSIKYEGLSYGIDIYRNENQKTSKEIGIFMVISI